MNKIKLSTNEIEDLKLIQKNGKELMSLFGQIEFQLQSIELHKKDLITRMIDLRKTEADLVDTLQNKYGIGEINIETGEFIKRDADQHQ